MVQQEDIIVKGPEFPVPLFEGSFSEFIFQKMKSYPENKIFQINADTEEELTFGEMLNLSIQIGEGLIKEGLKTGDVVVLAGKNSTQLHAASFGTLFSGGVYATVEPEMKVFEMQLLFQQLQPKYVFCEHYAENDVAICLKNIKNNAKIIVIDAPHNYQSKNTQFKDLIATEADLKSYIPRRIQNPAQETALIVCSSGSTGIPKGVKLTHRGMVFQMLCWENYKLVDLSAPFLQTSHFFWISGILYTYVTCLFGGKRIYIKTVNEKSILNAIHKYKPQSTFLPPTEILSLLNYPDFKKYDVSSLRWLFTGGSSLPQVVIDRIKELSQHVQLIHGYGMTEMSGIIAMSELKGDIRSPGTPYPGISMKVVDISTGRSLGPNQVGELLFKSLGIMSGYIGNEEATQNAIDKDGWYHSGDLGYYNENKYIYIVDRIKEVIKFRSMQISPAEVEAFLYSLPEVKEAAVLGIPNVEDMYHPMALIVKKKGSNITAEEIKEKVKNNLSSHKQLRAGVFFVDELPRTSTGKLKRPAVKELGLKLYQTSKTI